MKKKIHCLLTFIFCTAFIIPLGAQNFIIGLVLDSESLEPLPYVNIGLQNRNIGTVSDEEGYFEFEVDAQKNNQDTLRFSMIGFEPKSYVLEDYLKQNLSNLFLCNYFLIK